MDPFNPIIVNVVSSLITKLGEKILSSSLYESPSVIVPQRQRLGDKFYEPYYQNAREIQVTGVALGSMISHICMIKNGLGSIPKTHLIANIIRRPLNVRLLLVDPNSKFIKERISLEKNPLLPDDIKKSIDALYSVKEYIRNLSEYDRAIKGSLEVRLLNERLPFSHFSIKPNSQKAATIFLGLMLSGLKGYQCPLICIKDKREQSDLYDVIEHQVFSLYNAPDTSSIFYWEGDTIH
jgi:hypothetical protein